MGRKEKDDQIYDNDYGYHIWLLKLFLELDMQNTETINKSDLCLYVCITVYLIIVLDIKTHRSYLQHLDFVLEVLYVVTLH